MPGQPSASAILSSATLASEQAFQAQARKALSVLQKFHHIFGTRGSSELALRTVVDELCQTMVRSFCYSLLLRS